MERKLLIEILELLKSMGTLKVLDTNKVTDMISKIENTVIRSEAQKIKSNLNEMG
tara:strand:+ start:239 stop:403 length:165 start_codon:yes stop_codon:yes gene_type:complete